MSAGVTFDFESTFGVLALTAFVSSFLTGITTIQTYIYIVNYKKDPLQTKSFVAIVWTLAMLHAILLMITTWHYLVKSFGNPLLILKIHWSSLAALTVSSTQIMIAQLFLARRVHVFMGSFLSTWRASSWFALFVICILGNFFASLSGVIKISVLKNVSEILQIRTNLLITLAFNISVDTLLTALLAWSLLNSKSGNKRSDRVIQWIVLCSINTGLLPSLSAMAGLILFLRSPNTFWFLFCVYLISDTYANSILANLNSRSYFKEKMLSPQRTPGSQGLGLSASILPSAFQVSTTRLSTDVEDLEMGVTTKSRIQETEESSGPESETVSAQGHHLSAYQKSNTPRRTISPS
ncbi:hypothetical protein PM082_020858 [Marasmius tenuissimus]|nr:hypothetical protein PM082_020858 [Marasmius tenuissimus]